MFLKPGSATLVPRGELNQPERTRPGPCAQFVAEHDQHHESSQIGEVIFTDAPFSIENGMLRPNLKLDRRAIAAKFNSE